MLITFEGTDGVGKSTVLYGNEHLQGLVDRISEFDIPLYITKQPGPIGFTPLSLEPQLNIPDLFLMQAYNKIDDTDDFIKYLIQMARIGIAVPDEVNNWTIDTFPLDSVPKDFKLLHELDKVWNPVLDSDFVLADRLDGFDARSCLRQVLFHTPSSSKLPGTPRGLVYLADHLLNMIRIEEQTPGTLSISDRYAESQNVYGKFYGSNRDIVWALYERHYTTRPDRIILLTADEDDLKSRLFDRSAVEAEKQNNKKWNSIDDILALQEGYKALAKESPRNEWIVVNTSNKTAEETISECLDIVKSEYHKHNKTF